MFKFKKKDKSYIVMNKVADKNLPLSELSWYGIFYQIKNLLENSEQRRLREEEERILYINTLLTNLRNDLIEEIKEMKDDRTYVYLVDTKYKPILPDIKGKYFIKGVQISIIRANRNLNYYAQPIFIGIRKVKTVISE